MANRKVPIVPGEIYHVFNRSIDRQCIFHTHSDYQRFFDLINYYRNTVTRVRFSHYIRLNTELRDSINMEFNKEMNYLVEIYAFCIMPNHMHFILKSLTENGISQFMNLLQHSYAKFYNTKYNRTGVLFQGVFKYVHIDTDEQFTHVTRYIHLNPVTSYLLKIENLKYYEWSSYKYYLHNNDKKEIVSIDLMQSFFQNTAEFTSFHYDQESFQKELHVIKHLLF